MKKAIAAALIVSALVLGGCSHSSKPQSAQKCEEDQPCWDCDTMGNRVCGEDLPQGVVVVNPDECPLYVTVCYDHFTPWVRGR